MVELNDEMLGAFLDGELDPQTHDAVAALISSNAQVRARLEALRASDALLRDAFPLEPAAAPALTAAIAPMGQSAAPAKVLRLPQRPSWTALAGASLAAALATLAVVGPGVASFAARPDGFAVPTALASRLETAPSGAAGADARIVMTMRTADGRYCREFETAQADGVRAGLACRADGAWRLIALDFRGAQTQGYRTASGDAAFESAIEALGAEPVDPAAERALVAAGWRAPR